MIIWTAGSKVACSRSLVSRRESAGVLALPALAEILAYSGVYYLCFSNAWAPSHPIVAGILMGLLFFYPIISNRIQRKTLAEQGLHWKNLGGATLTTTRVGLPLALFLYWVGRKTPWTQPGIALELGPWSLAPTEPSRIYPLYSLYALYALWQQYVLTGFLLDRLRCALAGKLLPATALAWLLFVASHLSNPILVLGSMIGGALFLGLFLRHRNLLPVALLHAGLGILFFKGINTWNSAIGMPGWLAELSAPSECLLP